MAAGPKHPPDLAQLADKVLLRDFAPAAVVVNANLEVVLFRGRTGDYLEHSPGAPSLQLLKLARESLALSLRTALNRAGRENKPFKQTGIELRHNGRAREIAIRPG